jgi:dienelactone hydrolase
MLTQTRPGAQGALLLSACVPTSEFGTPWADGVPVQIHMMDEDEDAELFLYPGDGHLFADSSLADFDEEAAALLKERVFAFLKRVG